MELKSKHFPLDDDKIIELFWERNEKAIMETDYKYKKYLSAIAYNIVHDALDCEECLNDTYLSLWNTIPPSKPNIFKAFITTIVRRVSINRYHSNLKKKIIPSEMTVSLCELEDFLSVDDDVSSDFDSVIFRRIISNFVRSLSVRKQFIFMSRYYVSDSIDIIAKNLNLSRSMINKELASIRSDLKEKLESEGYLI